MLIIPAIDLKDGHCVRLKQGVMENATVFADDPGATARHWLDQGARRLHLVDLNGAFAGKPKNELAIREIIEAIGDEIPTQLGGGIRDLVTDGYFAVHGANVDQRAPAPRPQLSDRSVGHRSAREVGVHDSSVVFDAHFERCLTEVAPPTISLCLGRLARGPRVELTYGVSRQT